MTELVFDGRYGCPACAKRFHTLSAKKRHIRTHHRKDHR